MRLSRSLPGLLLSLSLLLLALSDLCQPRRLPRRPQRAPPPGGSSRRYRRLRHGSSGFRAAAHQTPAGYRPDYSNHQKEDYAPSRYQPQGAYSYDDGYSSNGYNGYSTDDVNAGGDGYSSDPDYAASAVQQQQSSGFPSQRGHRQQDGGGESSHPQPQQQQQQREDRGHREESDRPAVSAPEPSQCPAERECTELDRRYRSMDGSCNNLRHTSSGQSGQPFVRLLPRKHSVMACTGDELPNVRKLSRVLIRRGEDHRSQARSAMLWNFGQLVDHDIELTPPRQTSDGEFLDCCADENLSSPDCCPIQAPADDPFYGHEGRPTCMPFLRSLVSKRHGPNCERSKADVCNANSAWLDGSATYGADDKRSAELRQRRGGKLKITKDNRGRDWPVMSAKEDAKEDADVKMDFGDNRGDVTPAQVMLTTVFLRQHNRMAERLAAMHGDWDDEKLFQEARKINVALLQHVTYTQFLNALLGTPNNVATADGGKHKDVYDPKLDGGISVGFSTAGYRLHTYVSGHIQLRDRNFNIHGQLRLRDIFHKPKIVVANDTYDDVMRGLAGQGLSEFDNVFTPEMTEWLFTEDEANFGMDIAALNIQRGRDHRMPGYPAYKKFCGLSEKMSTTWNSLTDLISPELVHRLVHAYKRVDDVDLYVGGNMEAPVEGSILGPTFHCLVRDQFERLRNADRFFYTNPGHFTPRQMSSLGRVTLSRLMCDNADDRVNMALPADVFRLADSVRNPVVSCANKRVHPPLDLEAWR